MRQAAAFGVTRLYLSPMLRGIEGKLRSARGPVHSLIERDFDRRIDRVEQSIAGALLELADTVHPADRFSCRMELRR